MRTWENLTAGSSRSWACSAPTTLAKPKTAKDGHNQRRYLVKVHGWEPGRHAQPKDNVAKLPCGAGHDVQAALDSQDR